VTASARAVAKGNESLYKNETSTGKSGFHHERLKKWEMSRPCEHAHVVSGP
jgi:hypothetical protein